MTRESNLRTIFKLCACGKSSRTDSFKKNHGHYLKNDKGKHYVAKTKYYCIKCDKFKLDNENLKNWHLSHVNCESMDTNQDVLSKIFREELKQLSNNETRATTRNIQRLSESSISSLSEESSDDDIIEKAWEQACEKDKVSNNTSVGTQTDLSLQNNTCSNVHQSAINAKDELIKANRSYKDENFKLKAHNAELQKQVDEYLRKKSYLDQHMQELKELEIQTEKLKLELNNFSKENSFLNQKITKIEINNKNLEHEKENLKEQLTKMQKCENRTTIHIPVRNDLVLSQPMKFNNTDEDQFCFKNKKRNIKCIHLEIESGASGHMSSIRHVPPYRKKRKFFFNLLLLSGKTFEYIIFRPAITNTHGCQQTKNRMKL